MILVATRSDGGDLSPADLDAAEAARARMLTIAGSAAGPAIPVVPSADGKAALAPVPLDSTLTGFALSDKVKALREAARDGLPSDLVVLPGGPLQFGDQDLQHQQSTISGLCYSDAGLNQGGCITEVANSHHHAVFRFGLPSVNSRFTHYDLVPSSGEPGPSGVGEIEDEPRQGPANSQKPDIMLQVEWKK